jgi:NAD(P)-dependent dehydrogenase (short-subunit alcohol dehydrogenase family)
MTVVVVTGASRGIGLELADQLLRRGDHVIATHRDEPGRARLEALRRAPTTGTLTLHPLDVRDGASIERLATALNGSVVDVLINNAGIMGPDQRGIEGVDYEAWLSVLSVNVLGPFHVTAALLPSLRRSEQPRVITLSSIMGCLHRKSSGHYAYRSSKAAVNKVMQLLASDLAAERIIACPVNPGWVKTDMGGDDAPLTVRECARGLIALFDRLTLEDSGRFWQWDGSELLW